MNSPRQRRVMSPDEMLDLMPGTADEMKSDEPDLQSAIEGLPAGYFEKAVYEKWCQVTTVFLNGVKMYRFYFQTRADGKKCHVLASLFVGTGKNDADVWAKGAELIARRAGCESVTFETRRRGHVIQAQSWGAKVTGVMMEKFL